MTQQRRSFQPLLILSILAHVVYAGQNAPGLDVVAIDRARQSVRGTLTWAAERNRPLLRLSTGEERPLERFVEIRVDRAEAGPWRGLPWFDLRLWGAERVAVQKIVGRGEQIQVTLGGQVYTWPSVVLAQITHYGELRPAVRASFDTPDSDRSVDLAGNARPVPGKGVDGTTGVELTREGDGLTAALARPIAEGTVELLVFDPGRNVLPGTFVVELLFRRGSRAVPVQVLLINGEEFWGFATPEGPPSAVEPITRRPGWHRVAFELENDRIQADIDDAVLSVIHQPLGQLTELRVRLQAKENRSGAPRASSPAPIIIDDLRIYERRPAVLERQPSRNQDEVVLYDGQQFYGVVTAITDVSVALRSDQGTYSFPWSVVYSVYFAPRPVTPHQLVGQRVRVLFSPSKSGRAPTWSNIEGVMQGLTDEALQLMHPVLGEIALPRDSLRRLYPGRYGHWLLLDHSYHHLGDEVDLNLQRPYPEGNEVSWTFELEHVPEKVWLVADVVDLEPMREGAPYYQQLREGFLRTEVILNGKTVDFLNRYVPLGQRRQPKRIRLELPRAELRVGKNVLGLRQQPQKQRPGSFDDFGIFAVSLEWDATKEPGE